MNSTILVNSKATLLKTHLFIQRFDLVVSHLQEKIMHISDTEK